MQIAEYWHNAGAQKAFTHPLCSELKNRTFGLVLCFALFTSCPQPDEQYE
jgi:hypothetical protein